jgi:hypothetical protein
MMEGARDDANHPFITTSSIRTILAGIPNYSNCITIHYVFANKMQWMFQDYVGWVVSMAIAFLKKVNGFLPLLVAHTIYRLVLSEAFIFNRLYEEYLWKIVAPVGEEESALLVSLKRVRNRRLPNKRTTSTVSTV